MPHAMAATCAPGDLDLDLVSATGTGATSHPLAKCFSSMTVSVLSDCTLTLTANGQNNFVPALWSAVTTYDQVIACPTGVSMDFADAAAATATTGLESLLATSVYAEGMTASVAAESGIVTVISTYLGHDATLKFRSSDTTGSALGMFAAVGAPICADNSECAPAASGCGAGLYPILVQNTTTYVCALCSSGTYSAAGATSCTKCASGSALADVGATSNTCSTCSAGTFATLGSSDCRPCAPGMYQNQESQSSCKSCPSTWSSHTYGATQCVKCTKGRPAVCDSDCSDTTPGSIGSFAATVAASTLSDASGWASGYAYPALLNPCSPASTLVSFTVDATCAMEIRALAVTTQTDGKMCSDPSNTASGVIAYYVDAATIMTRLSEDVAKGNIVKIVKSDATTVTMSVIAATSFPEPPNVSISGDLTVNGGALVGASGATCPAGTIASTTGPLTCTACDPGTSCAQGVASATTCNAGTFSTLGQGACTSCSGNTYAPETGSSECTACASPGTVNAGKTTCDGATSDCGEGKQMNPATNICECAPGYGFNAGACNICAVNEFSAGGTDVCAPCDTDTFSAAGSESCGVCPAGEAQDVNGACNRCAAGQEPNTGSLACVPCPSGFYNPAGAIGAQFDKCQRCDGGKKTDVGQTACTACGAGTYSTWTDATTRLPSNATTCASCPDGGYSAAGAKRCTPCAGGSEANSNGDGCAKCSAGTFRTPYSSGGCAVCPAGTAAKAGSDSCTTCGPGQYAAANSGTCSSCAVDTYSTDSGSTTCVPCQAGFTTLGETGATECSGCAAGTKYDTTSKTCVDCDPGYYQDREGQKTCKKCPIGKFSDEAGATTCDSCPAGKYQSVAGSNSCRTCPGGTFSSAGKGSCSICTKGKYSAPGSTACKSCTAGYYANKLGSRSCTACPAGSKCAGVGNPGPTLCAAGSFQSKPAQTTCTPCPRKTNAAKAGATKCTSCPAATTVGTTTCPTRRRMLLTRLDTDIFQ